MTPLGKKTAGVISTLAGKLRGASTVAGRPVAQAAHAAQHATQAARPAAQQAASQAAHATQAARPAAKQPAAYAATHAVPSQPHMDWGSSAGWGGAPQSTTPRAPRAQPNAAQTGNAVDQVMPGFLGHDRRLRELQGKLQAREAAGTLSKSRGAVLDRIGDERKDLYNQLAARAGDVETTIAPHMRQGREVALGNRGLTEQDTNELFQRTMLPRQGTTEQRAQRMMPALSSAQYERQALMRGQHDPAMREIANTIGDARARNAMIPQAIQPKLGALGAALHHMGAAAHKNPAGALAAVHATDQALLKALYGGVTGGLGGALVAPGGGERDGATRGALLGALAAGGYGAVRGHKDATALLASEAGKRALRGRLNALRDAGGSMTNAFTAYKSASLAASAGASLAGLAGGANAARRFWKADPESTLESRLWEGAKGFGQGAALGGALGYGGFRLLGAIRPASAKNLADWTPYPVKRPRNKDWHKQELMNKLYKLYKAPAVRLLSGTAIGYEGASAIKDKLDNWRLAQYAAERMKAQNPNMEHAPQLGSMMAQQERGDYRKAS